jgi:DNA-binding IscR family transcriptional regulator
MVFSKSFGYAVRGVLYIATMNGERKRIQLDEIAEKLTVPRFFLGKIMQKMVKEGILSPGKENTGVFPSMRKP